MVKRRKRWVKCNSCSHQFESQAVKPKCGKCLKKDTEELGIQVSPKELGKAKAGRTAKTDLSGENVQEGQKIKEEPVEYQQIGRPDYQVPIGMTQVWLPVEALADTQSLIRAGMARNPSELMAKLVKHHASTNNNGGGSMSANYPEATKPLPTTPEMIQMAQSADLMETMVEKRKLETERMRKEIDGPRQGETEQDWEDRMFRLLEKQKKWEMLSGAFGGNNNKNEKNADVELLKAELDRIRQKENLEPLIRHMESLEKRTEERDRLLQQLLQNRANDKDTSLITTILDAGNKDREEREKIRAELDRSRMDSLTKISEMQSQALRDRIDSLAVGKSELDRLAEILPKVRELQSQISGQPKEEGIEDRIGKIINAASPALKPISEGIGDYIRNKGTSQNSPPAQNIPQTVSQELEESLPFQQETPISSKFPIVNKGEEKIEYDHYKNTF